MKCRMQNGGIPFGDDIKLEIATVGEGLDPPLALCVRVVCTNAERKKVCHSEAEG